MAETTSDDTSSKDSKKEEVAAPDPAKKTDEEMNEDPAAKIDPEVFESMAAKKLEAAPALDESNLAGEFERHSETANRLHVKLNGSEQIPYGCAPEKWEQAKEMSRKLHGKENYEYVNWLAENKLK